MHRNLHQGKVGVLCLAPSEGLGIRDAVLRERHLAAINRFRGSGRRRLLRGENDPVGPVRALPDSEA